MPINQFSSGVPEPVRWRQEPPLMEPTQKKHEPLWGNSQFYDNQHHCRATDTAAPSVFSGQNASLLSFNRIQEDNEEVLADERDNRPAKGQFREQLEPEKEPMFEKPLTPSDVGKLNRLVIPKQHAEKYFPLGGGDSGEKGLLLSFEDELGRCWRFRYSYWNSSQSYVLTKGWSRFVKEKRLDAGDVVLFERHRVDRDRFFICHRRRSASVITAGQEIRAAQPAAAAFNGGIGGGGGWSQVFYSTHSYPSHPWRRRQPECLLHGDTGTIGQSQTPPSGSSKRSVRLFGVDLECDPDESEPSTSDGSSMSSQGQAQHQQQHCTNSHSSNHQSHMEINFLGDVNQMKYHPQG